MIIWTCWLLNRGTCHGNLASVPDWINNTTHLTDAVKTTWTTPQTVTIEPPSYLKDPLFPVFFISTCVVTPNKRAPPRSMNTPDVHANPKRSSRRTVNEQISCVGAGGTSVYIVCRWTHTQTMWWCDRSHRSRRLTHANCAEPELGVAPHVRYVVTSIRWGTYCDSSWRVWRTSFLMREHMYDWLLIVRSFNVCDYWHLVSAVGRYNNC